MSVLTLTDFMPTQYKVIEPTSDKLHTPGFVQPDCLNYSCVWLCMALCGATAKLANAHSLQFFEENQQKSKEIVTFPKE